jgi:NhaP-type Na+/H+ or K+/H+ antiporter
VLDAVNETTLILAAALMLLYGAVSRVAERSVVTPPMVFMLAGVLFSSVGLDYVDVRPGNRAVELLAQIGLVIVLCSDASKVDRHKIRQVEQLPIRLLAIGLPLTMALGAGLAVWLFDGDGLPLAALALLGVLLAPTDAALGQAVIDSDEVPNDVRESLNVESGLNDGIALPPVFALLFALGADLADIPTDDWLRFTLMQVVLGPIAGAVVGGIGGRLIEASAARNWLDPAFLRLSMPSIALLGYALAEIVGGNGFIGAFVAGFALGVRSPAVRARMQTFGDTEGTALSLLVMLLLGLVLVPAALPHWSATTTLYAVLSLTVARMLPVAVSLLGLGLDLRTQLFIGWFGPRGIASILYLLMWVKYLGVGGYEVLLATGVETIALSVVLHGLTAAPLAARYGRAERASGSASEAG